ncbi:MAG: hypothetical protein ABR909_04010 [Candidatus Bathyarchaeia archaeon]
MRSTVQRLSLKDWKQPLPEEESIYILIAEKKAILAKTSELIRNSKRSLADCRQGTNHTDFVSVFRRM